MAVEWSPFQVQTKGIYGQCSALNLEKYAKSEVFLTYAKFHHQLLLEWYWSHLSCYFKFHSFFKIEGAKKMLHGYISDVYITVDQRKGPQGGS